MLCITIMMISCIILGGKQGGFFSTVLQSKPCIAGCNNR